jgi:hypothetical protein
MFGDHYPVSQPFWEVQYDTLEQATRRADGTYEWMKTTWIPQHGQSVAPRLGTDSWCVFVFSSTDELGERPRYVRGNPNCDTE